MGELRFGQLPKCLIEREFLHTKGAESIRSSGRDFGFVVQPLHNPAGKLLFRLEIIENQLAVSAERARYFLHRLNAGSHHLLAPEVQVLCRPGRRVVLPKPVQILFEQIGSDRLKVEAEQIAEAVFLIGCKVCLAFEDAPPGLL